MITFGRAKRKAQWQETRNLQETVQNTDLATAVQYAMADANNLLKSLQTAQNELNQTGAPTDQTIANIQYIVQDFQTVLTQIQNTSNVTTQAPQSYAPAASKKVKADIVLTKTDKACIESFIDHQDMEGTKVRSENGRLDIVGMGGHSLAEWFDDKIYIRDLGTRSEQTVVNYLRKNTPAAFWGGNRREVTNKVEVQQENKDDEIGVECKFCHKEFPLNKMKLHQDEYVCPECWDERLVTTGSKKVKAQQHDGIKSLTRSDWKHIRETIKAQYDAWDMVSESPEEQIMTSIGYVTVGLLNEDTAFVSGRGWGEYIKVHAQKEEEPEPEDEDAFMETKGNKLSVSVGGKFLGKFVEYDDAEQAIREWGNKNQFWPNVWTVSDHGNFNLIKDFNWDMGQKKESSKKIAQPMNVIRTPESKAIATDVVYYVLEDNDLLLKFDALLSDTQSKNIDRKLFQFAREVVRTYLEENALPEDKDVVIHDFTFIDSIAVDVVPKLKESVKGMHEEIKDYSKKESSKKKAQYDNMDVTFDLPEYVNDSSYSELLMLAGNFHGGQGDPLYAVMSRGSNEGIYGEELLALRRLLQEIADGKYDKVLDNSTSTHEEDEAEDDEYLMTLSVVEAWLPWLDKFISENDAKIFPEEHEEPKEEPKESSEEKLF